MESSEIKFRGYWKGVNQMVYFDKAELSYVKDGRVGMFIPSVSGNVYMGDSIDMQYLGWKDKNGKDVYDGDIVRMHIFTQELGEGLGVREGEKETVGEISQQPLGSWIQCEGEEDSGYVVNFFGTHEESFEVIGNIYENPELLK